MAKNPTNGELHIMLSNLDAKISEGFTGIHSRQDTTNGKVVKNEQFRIQAQTSLSILKWLFGFLGIGNLALIVKLFIS